jgi:plasmid stabilization system protein ParE
MSEFVVNISEEAREQLRTIARWYVRKSGSMETGLEWHTGFIAAINSLAENPGGCGLAHESDKFPFELRALLYGSGKRKTHRALFRIDGDQVRVLAIRHLSQKDVTPDDFAADD